MKLAVVTTSYPHANDDSAGHFVEAEVHERVARGDSVSVFLPKAGRRRTEPGVRLVELPHLGLFGPCGALARIKSAPWRTVGAIPFVREARRELLRMGPFDRIVAHWLIPCFFPLIRWNESPVEVVIHGSDWRFFEGLPGFLRNTILRELCRPNLELRCVSKELAAGVSAQFGAITHLPIPPIRVAPATLDLPHLPCQAELRKELGITRGPVAVVVARLIAKKRVDVALLALERVGGFRILVLGDGPLGSELRRRFPRVEFLGHRPRRETLRWVRAADLLVSASREEGASTIIREARILGTPVVSLASGDLLETAINDPHLFVMP